MKHELTREEKQAEFEKRWYEGRVSTDVWKYIPDKKLQGITDTFANSDGYWIYLDDEEGRWVAYDGFEDCGTIHELTIADLKEAIKTIRKLQKAN